MKKSPILVIGSINADHVLQTPQFPQPGETITGHNYQICAGGKGGNQAVACARSGGNIKFLACAGNDDFTRSVINNYQTAGMDTSLIQQLDNVKTGVALIYVNDQAENCIGISAEANDLLNKTVIEQHYQAIADAEFLLMQLETPVAGIEAAAMIARQNGTTTILNPAPARSLPDSLLSNIDIITPNQTEAEYLTGIKVTDESSARTASEVLHTKGVKTVIITMGRQGAFLSTAEKYKLIPGYSVKATDTTAAGDTFNGAMVVALAEGRDIESAICFAHGAAALSVTRPGAMTSIPDRDDILQYINHNHVASRSA